MRVEDLAEACVRGFLKALVPEPAATPPAKVPAKTRRPRRKQADSAPAGTTVIQSEMPTPGFDQVDEPLPGFEGIPRATLREMEAAMEKITHGNQPPPGFYDPNEADQRAPLS